MNIQDWFSLGWTDWISLLSKGLSRVFSNTPVQKHQFFSVSFQLSYPYMTTGKTKTLTRRTLKWVQFTSFQSFSHVWLFATPWTAACQASLSITNSQSPPKLMSIASVMSSNHWTAREVLLLFYFHFCCLCFWCHIQNHHQDRCHRGSMVSGLTFKSFIHFEFRGNDDPAVENFPSGANIACWNIPNISYHSFSLKHLPVLKFHLFIKNISC